MCKTMTFAAVHFTTAFMVAYIMTGNIMVGGAIALVEPVINTVAYYFHERILKYKQQSNRTTDQPMLFQI